MLANFLPFVRVNGLWSAFILVVWLSVFNTFLKPLLVILTIPITIFTMGLFLLIINGLIILLADYLVKGVHIEYGLIGALGFSLLLSITNAIVDTLLGD